MITIVRFANIKIKKKYHTTIKFTNDTESNTKTNHSLKIMKMFFSGYTGLHDKVE